MAATKGLGWIPDVPDIRDFKLGTKGVIKNPTGPVLQAVDLRPKCPVVYDQGQLGSCTAQAIAGLYQFTLLKQKLQNMKPSALFIYYNERVEEGTVASDSGAMIRTGMKVINTLGACRSRKWPYVIPKFKKAPPKDCYRDALDHQSLAYARVPRDLVTMKAVLSSGQPFVFGFSVYDSFYSSVVTRTGNVSMPGPDESLLGGHAVMAVGYDDARGVFIVRNSWGSRWGAKGYFYMPYAYLTDPEYSGDFWTLSIVE